MNLKRCEQGHFYDADKYFSCPHCKNDYNMVSIPLRFQNMGEITFLDQGSVGRVYKIKGNTEYALKIIECDANELKFQNALYELDVMKHLSGLSRVIQMYEYEIVEAHENKTICILEDYHVRMKDFLSCNQVFVSDGIKIIIGICDALLVCQEAGILHLDVHPQNIYVDDLETVKIGDFSSSLFYKDALSNNKMRGTLDFMAPEVYRKGNCSELSDIYSTGLVIYWLFNKGCLPFMDSESKDVSVYKRLDGIPFPTVNVVDAEISNELNRIIKRACSYSVRDRYQSISELKTELFRLLKLIYEHAAENEILYTPCKYEHRSITFSNTYAFDADPDAHTVPIYEVICDDDTLNENTKHNSNNFPSIPCPQMGQPRMAEPVDTKIEVPAPNRNYIGRSVCRCPMCNHQIMNGANFCSYCGCRVIPHTPKIEVQKVEFSVVAPKILAKGNSSIINVIMYEEAFRYIVDTIIKEKNESAQEVRSGIHKVEEDSEIKIVLNSPDITIDDNIETGLWQGKYLGFTFVVFLPEQYKKRQILFHASVYVNNVIATKLKFIVKCLSLFKQKIFVSRRDILSAFISYASQDRNRVAAIVQGMKKARPDMDVFFDVESLRSGDNWEAAIHQEIENRDVLFLCWSHFARESKWVDEEWRYAFKQKGADGIEPIPLELPDICPPPEELRHKHFNDTLLYMINATDKN